MRKKRVGEILGTRGRIMGTKFQGLILKYLHLYEKIEYHSMVNFLGFVFVPARDFQHIPCFFQYLNFQGRIITIKLEPTCP